MKTFLQLTSEVDACGSIAEGAAVGLLLLPLLDEAPPVRGPSHREPVRHGVTW